MELDKHVSLEVLSCYNIRQNNVLPVILL